MVNFKELFKAFECFFKYFSGKFNFQGLFKTIPVYSSTFQACANPDLAFILFINVKMPTIVGILTLMNRINFILSSVVFHLVL